MNESLNNEIRTRFPHLSETDILEIGLLVIQKEKKAMEETADIFKRNPESSINF